MRAVTGHPRALERVANLEFEGCAHGLAVDRGPQHGLDDVGVVHCGSFRLCGLLRFWPVGLPFAIFANHVSHGSHCLCGRIDVVVPEESASGRLIVIVKSKYDFLAHVSHVFYIIDRKNGYRARGERWLCTY